MSYLLMQLIVSLLKFCQLLTLYKGVFSYVFHFFFDVKVHLYNIRYEFAYQRFGSSGPSTLSQS